MIRLNSKDDALESSVMFARLKKYPSFEISAIRFRNQALSNISYIYL